MNPAAPRRRPRCAPRQTARRTVRRTTRRTFARTTVQKRFRRMSRARQNTSLRPHASRKKNATQESASRSFPQECAPFGRESTSRRCSDSFEQTTESCDGRLFQSAHLRLTHADFLADFVLRLTLVIAHFQHAKFSFGHLPQRFRKRYAL